MSNWVGYAISVNCGEPLGCYQGTILETDGNTITLTKAFRNGFPYPKSQVTLNAADIKDLKIIESRAEPSEQTHSTVAVTKNNKKVQRATVCENLQAMPANSTNSQVVVSNTSSNKASSNSRMATGPARSKPIDIQGMRNNKTTTHSGSYGASSSTPKGRGAGAGSAGGGAGGAGDKARRRNEACFGSAASPALLDDFDFEGNLALFNKRAIWEQLRRAHQPDVVRHADEGRLRPDQHVLRPEPRRLIRLPPALRAARRYVTDEGLAVPAACAALRARLWAGVRRLGLLPGALALLARGAADVALRLLGGGRRLEARNAHQAPVVVALAGPHALGAAALLAARLLASHGARAAALLTDAPAAPEPALALELAALAPAGVELAPAPERLPRADLVLLALHEPEGGAGGGAGEAGALRWAGGARGAVLALEPPAAGWPGVAARGALVALLPPALAPALGRVFLADVAPPQQLFDDEHVTYAPPFGASPVLALHPADD